MQGVILFGINNIYSVACEGEVFECRIKGKKLSGSEVEYNPLTAGDLVLFESEGNKGMILERLPRDNAFTRFNKKRRCPQSIGANFDILLAVSSPDNPPFRPRFLDRVFVSAPENCKKVLVLNKCDLDFDKGIKKRVKYFESIGVKVFYTSATSKKGIKALKKFLSGHRVLFVGQSGVGKSSLINALRDDISQLTGDISFSNNRGRHTTNFSALFLDESGSEFEIIDTPGIREIEVYGIEPEDLHFHYPDFDSLASECSFIKCRHISEKDCAVKFAVENGLIPEDRYLSYLNTYDGLVKRKEY